MAYRLLTLLAFCCWVLSNSCAQTQTDSLRPLPAYTLPAAIVLDFSFGVQTPLADMRTNFKENMNLAGKINLISPKHWIFALSGEYIFSDRVRTDVVANLRNPDGLIIDRMGTPANVQLGQRGFYINGSLGKLLIINPQKRRRAGLELRLSVGYLQHKVRIKSYGEDLLQVAGEYKHGYDRLTAGIAFQQFVGYRYMSANRLKNIFFGFDFTQGLTKNLRGYNFDQMSADTGLKLDILIGFRAGISIPFPIYTMRNTKDDVFFY